MPYPDMSSSGTIAAVGAQTRDVVAGEEVYGMNDWFADGAP